MTQEEKQLLFKDLCARLPYNVFITIMADNGEMMKDILRPYTLNIFNGRDEIKPYLRPMSSMTEEEKEQCRIYRRDIMYQGVGIVEFYMVEYVNWLDSKHFDWRTDGNGKTLIQLGLALEAPEGMYKND